MQDEVITIREVTLTDGSKVYNVELRHPNYDAVTLDDAEDLAAGINALIRQHTNMLPRLVRA